MTCRLHSFSGSKDVAIRPQRATCFHHFRPYRRLVEEFGSRGTRSTDFSPSCSRYLLCAGSLESNQSHYFECDPAGERSPSAWSLRECAPDQTVPLFQSHPRCLLPRGQFHQPPPVPLPQSPP